MAPTISTDVAATSNTSKPSAREESVSPMTMSPKAASPVGRPKLETRDSQPRIASPLRTEQKINGHGASNGSAQSGLLPSPAMGGKSSPAVETGSEFPFASPPGAVGVSPTNDLVQLPPKLGSLEQGEESDVPTDLNAATHGGLSRKQTREMGNATPQGRRSVQFARSGTYDSDPGITIPMGHSREQSWNATESQTPKQGDKEKLGSQLMSKLRALTSPMGIPGHARSSSGWSLGYSGADERQTPVSAEETAAMETRFPGYEADADAEESATENYGTDGTQTTRMKRKRKFRREADGPSTAPTTPRATTTRLLPFREDSDHTPPASAPHNRPNFMPRRATMSDIPEDQRAAMSEGEGRDRLGGGSSFFRRGNNWVSGHKPMSYRDSRTATRSDENGTTRRPMNLRRLTNLGGHDADGSPSPWRARAERGTSAGQQKWRQIKASLKMLANRKKEEATRVEVAKSAELMAEFIAGAPAAVIFASMFQHDERGHRRVPVLLEQLRITVTDSIRDDEGKHPIFRVELEYGSNLARMKWVVNRSLQDLGKLHLRYKAEENVERYKHPTWKSERSKLPKFPKSAFPGFVGDFFSGRGMRFDEESDEEEPEEPLRGGDQSGLDVEMSGTERPGKGKRRRSSFQLTRKKSSRFGVGGSDTGLGRRPETVNERQRRKVEEYLHKLTTYVMFGKNSNRLCAFLEISALGMRLASEGYHGKEGTLSIRATRGVEYKPFYQRSFKFKTVDKWFLVRESYLVCVDSLEAMNVFDVILLDPEFTIERKRMGKKRDDSARQLAQRAKDTARHPTHHQLRIMNSERKWKLTARNEHLAKHFETSINFIKTGSEWAQKHRFDSFAPVRHNVWAQFLVDGRDYMWNVSRAISMARDVIYIHDWWLSPQLYMRRPAAISQKWRLDRLLQEKAHQGVKIYVIMYRNINTAIPIDSEFSKFSLLALNPEGKNNVFVQRSPNQLRQNTFFWAHHEKVLIVDHCVAFCGGVDLCFGRWDLPSHPVVDDKSTGFELAADEKRNGENCQLWPGKDYSNPRVQDFFSLDKPYEEMYDREKIPRMPWHDIGMQIVGQPARDLSRHFIQRWNFLLRQRTPSRPTPFLLPPTDFIPADIEALDLQGTCEIQILRSSSQWSMGTPKTECSIMNAYVDMIKHSDHFVYIENQFFITTSEVMGTKIVNKIGDALVERIIRAHEEDQWWRACILIPLMPGFQNAVDAQDGSSVRIIMECQFKSICRGPKSIFGRLRAHGIEPEDYIEFFALRSHGKIGPTKALVTEQLYIHAKCMIVDDRIAIIGSANINERSMLGSRDSEIAAIVRDKDMILSRMADQDYYVARFAHELRVRLMREHLGLDVDALRDEEMQAEQMENEFEVHGPRSKDHSHSLDDEEAENDDRESVASLDLDRVVEQKLIHNRHSVQEELLAKQEQLHNFNHDVDWTQVNNPHLKTTKKTTKDVRVQNNEDFKNDLHGLGTDKMLEHDVRANDQDARDTVILHDHEVLVSDIAPEGRGTTMSPNKNKAHLLAKKIFLEVRAKEEAKPEVLPPPPPERMDTHELGLPQVSQLPALPIDDDTDIGGPPLQRSLSSESSHILFPLLQEMRRPQVTPDCMRDPVADSFFSDIWQTVAENNTKIFRQVFRCQPDNEVRSWEQYREYMAFSARFAQSQGLGKTPARAQEKSKGRSGPPGEGLAAAADAGLEKIIPRSRGSTKGSRGSAMTAGNKSEKNEAPRDSVEDWAADQEKRARKNEPIFTPNTDEKANPVTNEKPDDVEGVHAQDFLSNDGTASTNNASATDITRQRTVTISEPGNGTANGNTKPETTSTRTVTPPQHMANGISTSGSHRRRRRATTRGSKPRAFSASAADALLDKKDAEELLKLVQGHLVVFPYDWLVEADESAGFLHAVDGLAPLEIYT